MQQMDGWPPVMRNAKRLLILAAAIPLLALAMAAQTEKSAQTSPDCPIEGMSPSDVVDDIWLLATQGELLTRDGWQQAGRFFTRPTPFPGNRVIQIMSNYWGPASVLNSNKQRAEVYLGYLNLGTIDSDLRYSPAPEPHSMKMAMSYHLVLVPGYTLMYSSDGKTLTFRDKKPTGKCVWQIEGGQGTQWTTVNTAIRYVMEARDKTRDEVTRRTADETLKKLKLYH
jgi:hypothetical protein